MRRFDLVLYVAGDRPIDPALIGIDPPDAVIVDLEESVAPANAEAARSGLAAHCRELSRLPAQLLVRVGSPTGPSGLADLVAVSSLPDEIGLVLPKPVDPETLGRALTGAGDRPIWCMGEEAGLAERLPALVAVTHRLEAVVIGFKDLAMALGETFPTTSPALRAAADDIRRAAQASGLRAIDGVALGSAAIIASAGESARRSGYDGISLIRPRDVGAARVLPPAWLPPA